jgi:hypothetical protein
MLPSRHPDGSLPDSYQLNNSEKCRRGPNTAGRYGRHSGTSKKMLAKLCCTLDGLLDTGFNTHLTESFLK